MQLNVVMSVVMPLQLAQRVEKAVKERGTSISGLLREAIERHLGEQGQQQSGDASSRRVRS